MQIRRTVRRVLAGAMLLSACWVTTVHAEEVSYVNINTADAETLSSSLVGVGTTRAEAIIAYREAQGGFVTVEELANVTGIGMATLNRNLERIRIEDD